MRTNALHCLCARQATGNYTHQHSSVAETCDGVQGCPCRCEAEPGCVDRSTPEEHVQPGAAEHGDVGGWCEVGV